MNSRFAFPSHLLLIPLSFVVVHAASAADAVERGKALYHATCAMCHGQELKASGGIPDLRRTRLDDQGFRAVVRDGRPGTIMPSMKHSLSDEDIAQIGMYIRTAAKE